MWVFNTVMLAVVGLIGVANSLSWNYTENTTVTIDAYCNMGFWNIWPIAKGYCGVCTGEDCGGVSGVMLDCDSDWAKLYWYADVGCSGDAVNYTELEYFKCDLDYDCPTDYIIGMGLTGYENEDCSGDESLNAELPIVDYAKACIPQEDEDDGTIYYLLIAFYQDTIYLGVFDNGYCNGTVYYWQQISDGYCDDSTEYSFEPYGETKLEGDCNYGIFNNWPMASEFCGSAKLLDQTYTDNGITDISLILVCEEDWAAIIFFSDDLCGFNDGTIFNWTFVDTFYCSKDTCDPDDIILMEFTEYEEEDCDGDKLVDAVVPLAGGTVYCSNEGGYFLGVSVTEDGFFYGVYLDSDCDGKVYYNATFGDGSCDNTTGFEFEPFEDQVIFNSFDCDMVILSYWPLASGYCSFCEGDDCDETGSINFECNDDGTATIYEYSDTKCQTQYNSSEVDIAACDNDGDCKDDDLFVLGYTQYLGNNCSGDATLDATLYIASGDLCYGFASSPWAYYASIESSVDGIYVGIYLDDKCEGTLYGNISLEDGICSEEDNGNSSIFTFSEYTGGSSSSSDSDSSIPIQFVWAITIALLSAMLVALN